MPVRTLRSILGYAQNLITDLQVAERFPFQHPSKYERLWDQTEWNTHRNLIPTRRFTDERNERVTWTVSPDRLLTVQRTLVALRAPLARVIGAEAPTGRWRLAVVDLRLAVDSLTH
ncbi:MAG: hypothetical protein EPN91_08265 [Salinibacterium sp.]|nr:MAG: hypothetical protein EPN91_08265 [Salinibacterium sp.]